MAILGGLIEASNGSPYINCDTIKFKENPRRLLWYWVSTYNYSKPFIVHPTIQILLY
jgi:hypothetical protein